MQLELRDLKLGTKSQDRKRPYDLVEVARLDARPFQFLYAEGGVQRQLAADMSVVRSAVLISL